MSLLSVSLKECRTLIIDCMHAGLVPMITSSPGMGKSSMGYGIARDYNLELLDERASTYSPVDANGLPGFNATRTKSRFIPMENFPLESDPLPEGKDGWLLFFDEFNSATRSVQAAMYKLILDRKVGNARLHPKVVIMCAGNKKTDRAVVNEVGTAMQSRLVHLELHSDYKDWLDNAYENKYAHQVTAFINYRPELINNFSPSHSDKTFACERTWEFLSKLVKAFKSNISMDKLPLIAGTVGQGAGQEFYAFCQIYKDLPSIDSILSSPETVTVPTEPMNQWAIAGALAARTTTANAEKILTYLLRMEIQFQIMALKSMIKRDDKLISSKPIVAWIRENAKEI